SLPFLTTHHERSFWPFTGVLGRIWRFVTRKVCKIRNRGCHGCHGGVRGAAPPQPKFLTADYADFSDCFLAGARRGGRPTIGCPIRAAGSAKRPTVLYPCDPRNPWLALLRREGVDDLIPPKDATNRRCRHSHYAISRK